MSSKKEKKLRKAYRKSVDEVNVELANRNIAKLHATVKDLTLRNNALSNKLSKAEKKYKNLNKRHNMFLLFSFVSFVLIIVVEMLGV